MQTPIKGNIYQILDGTKQYKIPVYQRYYSWDAAVQCKKLWNDILDMEKHQVKQHFMGVVVNIAEQAQPMGVQEFQIIDGQQRITTLTLMLVALRDYLHEHPEYKELDADIITQTLLKNTLFEKFNDDRQFKLILTEFDKDALLGLIEKIPDTQEKFKETKIVKNYSFFKSEIEKEIISPLQLYNTMDKLQIVNITLEREFDDPQAIFESLNSTGKELSESDLIRNYILMGLPSSKQTLIYNHWWHPMEELFKSNNSDDDNIMDLFFRDYLTYQLARIPNLRKIYEEFKDYTEKYRKNDIENFCSDLFKFAKIYTDLIYSKHTDTDINSCFKDIVSLDMKVAYPFFLKVISDFQDGKISKEDLVEILKLTISYIVRRSICEIPTNALNKVFAAMKNHITETDYLNSIKAYYILCDEKKVFPTDDVFKTRFMIKDIYNMKIVDYILSHFENYDNKNYVDISKLTKEHIMPQNEDLCLKWPEWKKMLGDNWKEIHDKYLHTIGNLTLTAYNSEMSDNPFMIKMNMKGGFKESALRINSYVIKQTEWNASKIIERAEELTFKVLDIWKYPKLSKEQLEQYKPKGKGSKYSIETYDINAFNKMLWEKVDEKILELDVDIKRVFNKLYIAYKLESNFVDICILRNSLRIVLNMEFNKIFDPKNMCHDVSNVGRHENGDVEFIMDGLDQLDDVMNLIKQSYKLNVQE